eukprot:846696-Prymnesium_polylepis.1
MAAPRRRGSHRRLAHAAPRRRRTRTHARLLLVTLQALLVLRDRVVLLGVGDGVEHELHGLHRPLE